MKGQGYRLMKMRGAAKRIVTLLLVFCLLISAIPEAFAGKSVGNSSSKLKDSDKKYFIKVPDTGAEFFTGETAGKGKKVTVASGTVCMLVTDDYYTVKKVDYYAVYYKNTVYHVCCKDVTLLTDKQVTTYIENNVWGASKYTTLKMPLNLVGDVQVYGLQLALKQLGYYNGTLDGSYGKQTDDAVYKFQRANGLSKDGDAGPLTQKALYTAVLNKDSDTGNSGDSGSSDSGSSDSGSSGNTDSGSTGTTTKTGTLRTKVSVNLRQKASKSSPRLAIVPVNMVLTYYNTKVSGNVTWYQVVYNNNSGWLMGTYIAELGSSGTAGGSLTTIDSVNLRKSSSTSSTRLDVVPKGVTLAYSETKVSGGVTWYKVVYGINTGWLMGTYVNAGGNAGGGNGGNTDDGNYTVIGSLRITKTSTRVRKAPNGQKTGIVLAKGSTVSLIGAEVSGGKYTWYPVVTSSGVRGYVRSDCAQKLSSSEGSGSVTVSQVYTFAKLPKKTKLHSKVGSTNADAIAPKDTIVRLVDNETFKDGKGNVYIRVYYKGVSYYALKSDIEPNVLTDKQLASIVLELWDTKMGVNDKLTNDGSLHGNINVYAAQLALYALGYYTGTLDGTFGNETAAAVKNFQRAQKLEADGVIGAKTWPILCNLAKPISDGTTTVKPGGETTPTVTQFGNVNKVTKPTWDEADAGNYWPKYTFATVLDVNTGKVFTVYRTGGSNHPDAVPYTTDDTKTMCEIVGFTYPGRRPTTDELKKIANDSDNSNSTYTWPDFKGKLTGVKSIGSAWDRRPALLNVNGNVYAVSIYGWPHGFEGIGANDGLSTQKFPNGKKLYENNNYYGCMCIRFYNSKGHASSNQTVINEHNASCNKAYDYAKKKWPALCK